MDPALFAKMSPGRQKSVRKHTLDSRIKRDDMAKVEATIRGSCYLMCTVMRTNMQSQSDTLQLDFPQTSDLR